MQHAIKRDRMRKMTLNALKWRKIKQNEMD